MSYLKQCFTVWTCHVLNKRLMKRRSGLEKNTAFLWLSPNIGCQYFLYSSRRLTRACHWMTGLRPRLESVLKCVSSTRINHSSVGYEGHASMDTRTRQRSNPNTTRPSPLLRLQSDLLGYFRQQKSYFTATNREQRRWPSGVPIVSESSSLSGNDRIVPIWKRRQHSRNSSISVSEYILSWKGIMRYHCVADTGCWYHVTDNLLFAVRTANTTNPSCKFPIIFHILYSIVLVIFRANLITRKLMDAAWCRCTTNWQVYANLLYSVRRTISTNFALDA
jgi:hypothetical protein